MRRGMTAVELVVALAITALAASIGGAALHVLGDQRGRLLATTERDERAAAVRRTLVAWLEGAHGSESMGIERGGVSFQLLDGTRNGRAADELLFATTAPTPLGRAEALVRLYVDADVRSPEHGLVAELTAWPGAATMRVVLDSAVTALDIRCLTELLGGRRWVESWMSPTVLPRGIELRLRTSEMSRLDPFLRRPILVAVEGGR